MTFSRKCVFSPVSHTSFQFKLDHIFLTTSSHPMISSWTCLFPLFASPLSNLTTFPHPFNFLIPSHSFFLKRLFKTCGINDARSGYLSSYCIISLLVAYLQRTSPPVLPFLQELESEKCPKTPVEIDGHDTYFFAFDSRAELAEVRWRMQMWYWLATDE